MHKSRWTQSFFRQPYKNTQVRNALQSKYYAQAKQNYNNIFASRQHSYKYRRKGPRQKFCLQKKRRCAFLGLLQQHRYALSTANARRTNCVLRIATSKSRRGVDVSDEIFNLNNVSCWLTSDINWANKKETLKCDFRIFYFRNFLLQLVGQMPKDSSTRRAQRMPNRNCSAIYVQSGRIQLQLLLHWKHLGRKRFIYLYETREIQMVQNIKTYHKVSTHLHQIHLLQIDAGFLAQWADRLHRTDTHYFWVTTHHTPADDTRQRLKW